MSREGAMVTVLYIISIVIMLIIFVQLNSGMLTALIGNDFVSFTNRSYVKKPISAFDKTLNFVFFIFHGVPDYFYKLFMRRTSYWKARFYFLGWFFIFSTFCMVIFFVLGYFVENFLVKL